MAKALFMPRPETGESQRMSTKAVDDCDASTRDDDERSPTWRALGQVAQDGNQVASRHQVHSTVFHLIGTWDVLNCSEGVTSHVRM